MEPAEEEDEASSRARVWTSALNKQSTFVRQAGDRANAAVSSSTPARRRPFSVDGRDLPCTAAVTDGASPVVRSRTSMDVDENSFVLRPMLSSHAGSGPAPAAASKTKSKRRRSPPLQARGRSAREARQMQGHGAGAPRAAERPLSVRITNRLYGHRERPTSLPSNSKPRTLRGRRSMDAGPAAVREDKSDDSGGPVTMPSQYTSPRQGYVDDGVLTRSDSLFSRARRALSNGTQHQHQQFHRREESRLQESLYPDSYAPAEVELLSDVGPVQNRRWQDDSVETLEVSAEGRGERRGAFGDAREKPSHQEQKNRILYVDLDPSRQKGEVGIDESRSSVNVDHGTERRSLMPPGTQALQMRIRELESELAAATSESARMASLISELQEENKAAKSAVPILEDVLRKSRHHFDSKERALRLTIATMDTDLSLAIKSRNEAIRAVSQFTGRPVAFGMNRVSSGVAGGGPASGGNSRRKPSSWGSLEGSTAARRLRELEELSGPISGTGSLPDRSSSGGADCLADLDYPLD
jgi:hypothetical protein